MAWELVAVKWEDVTSIPRFGGDTDFESRRLYKLSVGFLVRETEEYIVIADDVDLSPGPGASNNYGTLIPKGCIRERRVVWPGRAAIQAGLRRAARALAAKPAATGCAGGRAGTTLRRFFEDNPHVLASTRDIARSLGMEEADVAQHLCALERREVVRQLVDGVYVAGPGHKAGGSGRKRRRPGSSR